MVDAATRHDRRMRTAARLKESGDMRQVPTTNYWTESGPERGPLFWHPENHAIGVLGSRADLRPIGRALQVGRTDGGIAIWSIEVEGREVPGRWIVVGREFLPKREGRRPLRSLEAPAGSGL
jgi:hypothetical protein